MRPYPRTPFNFEPAADLGEWVRKMLIDEDAPLFNPDHAHLADAEMGYLWTRVEMSKSGQIVLGQASLPEKGIQGNAWARGIYHNQILTWFDRMPDFLIILSADYCDQATDREYLSLIEHELYHCAHDTDEFGMPKFRQSTGDPVWCMAGHDHELFHGCIERYGEEEKPEQRFQLLTDRQIAAAIKSVGVVGE